MRESNWKKITSIGMYQQFMVRRNYSIHMNQYHDCIALLKGQIWA